MALFESVKTSEISAPKLRCRKCKGEVHINEFVMDPESKGLICSTCFNLKTQKASVSTTKQTISQESAKPKPKGWDREDEYLEQLSRRNNFDPKPRFEQIQGTNEGYMNCVSCGYRFKYNVREFYPASCPYCNARVPMVR